MSDGGRAGSPSDFPLFIPGGEGGGKGAESQACVLRFLSSIFRLTNNGNFTSSGVFLFFSPQERNYVSFTNQSFLCEQWELMITFWIYL